MGGEGRIQCAKSELNNIKLSTMYIINCPDVPLLQRKKKKKRKILKITKMSRILTF